MASPSENLTSASISKASSYPVDVPVKCLSNWIKENCLREYLTHLIQKSSGRSIKITAHTVSKQARSRLTIKLQ